MSELFDDIWDWVSGGQITRNRAERVKLFALESRLETIQNNYNYWNMQGTIFSKALYRITVQAFNEVCKLHDILAKLTVNQRNIIEHELIKKKYILEDIEKSIMAIISISNSSVIHVDTKQFAEKTLDGSLSILQEMPNSTGLAAAGVYTLISGLEHYASLDRQFSKLKASQCEALKRIKKMESQLLELKTKVHRADEIGAGLGKGISAFRHCYKDVYRKLFPDGEESKQKREERQASGGKYFLDNEKHEIQLLFSSAGYILKLIEAKP